MVSNNEPKAVLVGFIKAEEMTDLGRTKLYELVKEGRLKMVKIGRRSLLTVASIRNLAA